MKTAKLIEALKNMPSRRSPAGAVIILTVADRAKIIRSLESKAGLVEALENFISVGCEWYDMDCGENGSEAIDQARKAIAAEEALQ